jgi:hypothetical protein
MTWYKSTGTHPGRSIKHIFDPRNIFSVWSFLWDDGRNYRLFTLFGDPNHYTSIFPILHRPHRKSVYPNKIISHTSFILFPREMPNDCEPILLCAARPPARICPVSSVRCGGFNALSRAEAASHPDDCGDTTFMKTWSGSYVTSSACWSARTEGSGRMESKDDIVHQIPPARTCEKMEICRLKRSSPMRLSQNSHMRVIPGPRLIQLANRRALGREFRQRLAISGREPPSWLQQVKLDDYLFMVSFRFDCNTRGIIL